MRAAVCLVLVLASCANGPRSSSPDSATESTASAESAPAETSSSATPEDVVTSDAAEVDTNACGGVVEQVESVEYRSIPGVDPNLLSLDIHGPTAPSSCPAVVWVHGGAWQLGDKSTAATDVKAAHFVSQGYVFVSVNYRLVEESNDVRWPDFGNDAAVATAWILANADDIGVDPERVALIGHSAGGHLVSIVGTNPDLLASAGSSRSDVACVVSLDSVTHDLTDAPTFERDIIQDAFGDDEATLADGSPTLQAAEHADDGPVPDFLIATRGRDVRLESAAQLEASLLAAGASASVYDASPYSHRDVNVELGEPGESNITPAVTDFLADCLR